MELREIPIDRVVVNNRLRQPQEENIQALAESIESIGLLNPVVVKASTKTDSGTTEETFCMVAGVRWLLACKQLGHTSIPARIFQGTEIDDRLAEIDKNLCRGELSELEKGEHLIERKELYEIKYPETQRGVAGGKAGGRGRKKIATENFSFATNTAQKTGVTDPTKINGEDLTVFKMLYQLERIDPRVESGNGPSPGIHFWPEVISACVMVITPKLAKQWLERNGKNRNLKRRKMLELVSVLEDTQTPPPKKGPSEKSIEKAVEAISSTAVPELIGAVKSGKIKPVVAKRIVQLSQIEQRFFVDSAERGSNTLDSPKQAQERCSEGEVVYDFNAHWN